MAQLGGAYRGAPRQPSPLLWLLFHSLDLANTGVIPPGNISISTVHLRAWEMMTSWVNRFRGTHKIGTNLNLTWANLGLDSVYRHPECPHSNRGQDGASGLLAPYIPSPGRTLPGWVNLGQCGERLLRTATIYSGSDRNLGFPSVSGVQVWKVRHWGILLGQIL